jgi:hypothetical protein
MNTGDHWTQIQMEHTVYLKELYTLMKTDNNSEYDFESFKLENKIEKLDSTNSGWNSDNSGKFHSVC